MFKHPLHTLRSLKILLFSILLFIFSGSVVAQCPILLDGQGNPSTMPYWIGCTGGNYTVFIQSNSNIGPYSINFGDGSAVVTGSAIPTGTFVTHTYAATVDTFIVTFTDSTSGCIITGVVVMEITPSAAIQIPVGSPIFGCTPATFAFKNSTTNPSNTTRYTWNFGDGSPIQSYNYTNHGDTVYHTYLPGTTNCNVAVTLTAENYCNRNNPSINIYQPIQVWDIDNVAIAASATLLCYPDTIVHLDNVTNLNCYALGNTTQRYEYWNFGNYWGLGHDSIINWQPFSPPNRPGYNMHYPGIGTYTVMLVDSSYCGKDTAFITINIVPQPTAGISANRDTICAGQNITFSNLSGGGANMYVWNYGTGSPDTVYTTTNRTRTFNTSGDYTVTLTAYIMGGSGSCNATATYAIHVKPRPTAVFTTSPTNCDSSTVAFTNTSAGGIAWSWNFGNSNTDTVQNPSPQFYSSPGSYTVSLLVTSTNGCTRSTTRTVVVYESPVASFTTANACINTAAVFTDLSTHSPGDPIVNWLWDFGDGTPGSTSSSPVHTYTAAGTYSVILSVATANCNGKDTIPITINPDPVAQFTPVPANGCTPLPVTFTNTSTGAISYIWSFGNGAASSTAANPSYTYTNNTANDSTYTATLIAENIFGCKDTVTQPVTVYHGAQAGFTSNAVPACSPLPVQFSNTSVGATSYSWSFGDGSAIDTTVNPNHLFTNTTPFLQTYTVTLISISANGCMDSVKSTVTVFPASNITVSSSPSDSGCAPYNVSFASSSGGVIYQWDFGDGVISLFQNPSHVFRNTGTVDSTYYVSLIVTNPFSCKDTVYDTILVHPNPVASYFVVASSGCTPFNVSFNNTSTGAVSYTWLYGDGSPPDTAANPNHIYTNTTSSSLFYTATLIAATQFGCTDTTTRIIEVYPPVYAAFSADTMGCSAFNPNFQNTSSGHVSSSWSFGDGTFSSTANPVHSYLYTGPNDTTFTATLIVISAFGCEDTVSQNITIYPSPVAAFLATPSSQLYPSATVSFTNNTNPGNWQYTWTFGDGTTSNLQNPPNHTYATWGTYTVCLVARSAHCSDSTCTTITIIPPLPVANFVLSDTSGCEPLTIQFNDSSTYVTSYEWSFGDGSLSNQPNPSHLYLSYGTYTITLVVTGPGGKDTVTAVINVYPKPTAFFTSTPTTVYPPNQPVIFYNLSSNSNSYVWDFGDGSSSTEVSPQHNYITEGHMYTTLYAFNSYGCRDTFISPTAVKVEEAGEIVFPNAFTPNPNGPNGGRYNQGDYNNDVFFPFNKGLIEFEMFIYNRWGEIIFHSTDVDMGWDGYYKGVLCEQDVYIWKATGKFGNGDKVSKTGDVTLLR